MRKVLLVLITILFAGIHPGVQLLPDAWTLQNAAMTSPAPALANAVIESRDLSDMKCCSQSTADQQDKMHCAAECHVLIPAAVELRTDTATPVVDDHDTHLFETRLNSIYRPPIAV